jgi:hypothetical protein
VVAEASQLTERQARSTRARLVQLLERASFDLKLAQDAARALDEFAIVKTLARQRRELRDANLMGQTTRYCDRD